MAVALTAGCVALLADTGGTGLSSVAGRRLVGTIDSPVVATLPPGVVGADAGTGAGGTAPPTTASGGAGLTGPPDPGFGDSGHTAFPPRPGDPAGVPTSAPSQAPGTTKPERATTAPPTTAAPVTTAPPATEPPVTEPPTTAPPTTEPPVTEPPTTAASGEGGGTGGGSGTGLDGPTAKSADRNRQSA